MIEPNDIARIMPAPCHAPEDCELSGDIALGRLTQRQFLGIFPPRIACVQEGRGGPISQGPLVDLDPPTVEIGDRRISGTLIE